ncbi:MAG TPA: TerD family protein [Patescibacteria group bacterium]|nr:TerD family protein [Patescibacteria group bacterium]
MTAEAALKIATPQPGLAPAQPLYISPEGERRFIVGLSWGPAQFRKLRVHVPQLRDENGHYDVFYFFKLPFHLFRIFVLSLIRLSAPDLYRRGVDDGRKVNDAGRYDLDLSCYVFDRDMHLKCVIGPAEDTYVDPSKKLYHSGDQIHGSEGSGDDEQAFVETRGLPDEYHHFFFVVETDGRYSLCETPNIVLRLADSRTNTNALRAAVTAPAGSRAHGYVFAHVFRDGDGFAAREIGEFAEFSAGWVKTLQGIAARA